MTIQHTPPNGLSDTTLQAAVPQRDGFQPVGVAGWRVNFGWVKVHGVYFADGMACMATRYEGIDKTWNIVADMDVLYLPA